MEVIGPAPGWEKLWEAYERMLESQTRAYREAMAHAVPVQQAILAKRYAAQCEPIIRALAEIPTIPIGDG